MAEHVRWRDELANRPQEARVALFGAPFDHNSSFLRGPAQGPQAIRDALACEASHNWTELGIDAARGHQVLDVGDVSSDEAQWSASIADAVYAILEAGLVPVGLGGDHSVTAPVVKTLRAFQPMLTLVHFDAHPDVYDRFDGNPDSHASPFARIMETGAVERLVSVGIRTLNPHLREQCSRFGVELVEMRDLHAWGRLPRFDGPVYISFDLDALDPAFAPGVSHWEPGGLTTRQALDMLHSIDASIVGADVVELNPRRDVTGPKKIGLTAMVAAKLVREIIGLILRR